MIDQKSKTLEIEKVSLPVEGMTCASCVARVEKSISKLEGISDVVVNLATEKATFTIDKSVTKIDSIKKAVEEAGYKIEFPQIKILDESNIFQDDSGKKSEFESNLKKHFLLALKDSLQLLNKGLNFFKLILDLFPL